MKQLYTLLFFLCAFASTAQPAKRTAQCGTAALNFAEKTAMESYYRQSLQRSRTSATSAYTIYLPIRFILINQSDGAAKMVSINQLNESLARINKDFFPMGAQFFLSETKEIKDDRYFNFDNLNTDDLVRSFPADAINIFITNSIKTGPNIVGGFTYFPLSKSLTNNAVFITSKNISGTTLSHELGHYFYLYHTHEGSESSDPRQLELVNGSNCSTAGDLVCDTPADPGDGTTLGCVFVSQIADPNGQLYAPMTDNIMGYWFCTEDEKFTPGQYERMKNLGLPLRISSDNEYQFTAPATIVTAPGQLTTTSISSNKDFPLSPTLQWKDLSTNESGFLIERSVATEENFVAVAGLPANTVKWIDSAAPTGKTLYYRIRATNSTQYSANVKVASCNCVPDYNTSKNCSVPVGTIGMESLKIWSENKETILLDSKGICSQNAKSFSDMTNLAPIQLIKGKSFPFQVEAMSEQSGPDKGYIHPTRINIWIDLNQDQTFADDERLFISNLKAEGGPFGPGFVGDYPNPYLENHFTVPGNSKQGKTRMRIRVGTPVSGPAYLGPVSGVETPCESIEGETEDYLVEIIDAEKFIKLSVETKNVSELGASERFLITTTHKWTAKTSVPWIEIAETSGNSGKELPVNFTVSANSDAVSRIGTIIIAAADITKVFTVIQAGKQAPILKISAESESVAGVGESGNFNIETNYSWNATSNAAWLKVSPSSGLAGSAISVNFMADANTSASPRVGVISIKAEALSKTFTIMQAGQLITSVKPVLNVRETIFNAKPNPSRGLLNIDLKLIKPGIATIRMIDVSGKNLKNWNFYNKQHQIETQLNFNEFPSGIYFIKAEVDGEQKTIRIVKE